MHNARPNVDCKVLLVAVNKCSTLMRSALQESLTANLSFSPSFTSRSVGMEFFSTLYNVINVDDRIGYFLHDTVSEIIQNFKFKNKQT
jgi:hypothetical protein